MRKIYTVFLYLLLPLFFLRLLWKSRRSKPYRQRIAERFSFHPAPHFNIDVWIHAVSLGEVVAVTPLVERMLKQKMGVMITTMTPTGSQQVLSRFGSTVAHQYIPYDLPWCLRRFFKQIQPKIGIIMETELWPNMLHFAKLAKIPLVLVNARLSDRAFVYYLKLRNFFSPIVSLFTWIGAQSEIDRDRYQQLGAPQERVKMLGNIKFDLALSSSLRPEIAQLKQQWGHLRPVLLLASTHADEESQLLAQYPKLKKQIPDLLLLIAPRRPERFQEVYALVKAQGWQTGLRSQSETIDLDNEIIVLDSMGELMQFYQICDYAFVGGSLVPVGGHNVLEPIALEVPAFCGPFMQNAKSVCLELLKNKALQQCDSAENFAQQFLTLHASPEQKIQQVANATAVLNANKGALDRYWLKIEEILMASA